MINNAKEAKRAGLCFMTIVLHTDEGGRLELKGPFSRERALAIWKLIVAEERKGQ